MMLPVVKLGSLVLRTICKPIANRLKVAAGKHPRFREYIINIAQTNHRFTTTVQRRIYGHATDVAIRPLNEEKAVQAAADLLGEMFVFSVAGAAIIFEVQRSARSEARKEELRKQELEEIKQKEENLERELEFIKGKLAELEQLAKARGLSGIFNFRNPNGNENAKSGSEVPPKTDGQSATHARTTEDPKSAAPAHSAKDAKQGASPGH
ncbi:optic atrophy 3 protein homolog isoform X2 [Papaver somniferum]|uniref:optic atrophy 3 protein homolog isoform X2 n=1 Tax=Papaver somniferum TaxID=3469 RepID=UPI000E6FF73F|nr:optic atrophy 3 protein homolog isoform X2 [Papaver somniferum]